ncbi:Flp family type IVb pilin [Georgenia subflava]|uniref:Flp family type IVb pilin n=1 Tax=Georgenia subflava TaxID=1622177 RepID=A0A6N7EP54_9MICO|nr:Flp family type IVb pilin [Georgenia subflava]MPV37014.1 Flp family type IVb pilin [Georgenia subflava]
MNRAAAFMTTLLTVVGDRFEGRKDRGATAVEYGLMVGLIAVVIIGAVSLLGDELSGLFENVQTELSEVSPTEGSTAG